MRNLREFKMAMRKSVFIDYKCSISNLAHWIYIYALRQLYIILINLLVSYSRSHFIIFVSTILLHSADSKVKIYLFHKYFPWQTHLHRLWVWDLYGNVIFFNCLCLFCIAFVWQTKVAAVVWYTNENKITKLAISSIYYLQEANEIYTAIRQSTYSSSWSNYIMNDALHCV